MVSVAIVAAVVCCGLVFASYAATISVINMDSPGEGFNDPTPVAPVGGNLGTTLGEQRLNAAQFAVDLWAPLLNSNVDIRIEASFDELGGDRMNAVLAGASPFGVFRDFSGAPMAQTWYPAALSNALAGFDLDPTGSEIRALANSAIDGDVVLGSVHFYYGFDLNAGTNIDFVSVFAHEIGHGLGFVTFLDRTTGAKLNGKNDAFMLHLIHRGAIPQDFPSMTGAQRLRAMVAGPDLRWNGPNVKAASGSLTAGVSPAGDVAMYAPNPFESGSSVSHFGTALTPDEMMEPNYRAPRHDVGLALPLLQDIGWQVRDLCGDILLGQEACIETLLDNQVTGGIDLQGDTYTFAANEGDQVDLRVEAIVSTLDPLLILLGPNQDLLALGDDEKPCAMPLVCGGACPQIQGGLPATGNYMLIVLDSPFTSKTATACTGGDYRVTADGTGGLRLMGRAVDQAHTLDALRSMLPSHPNMLP